MYCTPYLLIHGCGGWVLLALAATVLDSAPLGVAPFRAPKTGLES